MAVKFADVVEELRQVVPELREAPVMCGSPLSEFAGPCFMPVTGKEYVRQVRTAVAYTNFYALFRFHSWFNEVERLPLGIHLPEEADLVQVYYKQAEFVRLLFNVSDEEYEQMIKEIDEVSKHEINILADKVREAGLEPTEEVMARFMVLHELGHYLDWKQAADKQQWLAAAMASMAGLVAGNGSAADYRNLEHEAKADAFALNTLKKLYEGGDR